MEKLELKMEEKVRVRFAPSPTGPLHIGGARTALFNYLFARKYHGSFILRIEDTDLERSEKKFEEEIMESLKWLGIEWDEGPDVGGDFGPYRQSERKEIYRKYLEKLLKEDKAYFCFCKKEELEAQRQYFLSIGEPPRYNGKCKSLSKEEVEKKLKEGEPFVVRFKVVPKKIVFEDLIRGEIEFDTSLIGDFVIAKGFDSFLYNFTCVVDDFEMKITHVIRGEDHLPNTPKQILLQEALEFKIPKYAHLPLILGADKSKLSKRHGAVSILDFKKLGYLPEALVNFIAFLGWSPKSEKQIFNLSSLVKEFSLERVQKSGAIFNIQKLDFLNNFYIRQKTSKELTELCLPFLIESGFLEITIKEEKNPPVIGATEILPKFIVKETGEILEWEKLEKICLLFQERMKKLSEISNLADFFFKKELIFDKELLKWKNQTEEEVKKALFAVKDALCKIEEKNWTKEKILEVLMEKAQKFSIEIKREPGDRGYLFWPFRVALTGKEASPPPQEIAEILGKKETLKRIENAIKMLK
jgi:nondiscriminating glutamyl-tRNA synthetase